MIQPAPRRRSFPLGKRGLLALGAAVVLLAGVLAALLFACQTTVSRQVDARTKESAMEQTQARRID